jgi:hypothetical protein
MAHENAGVDFSGTDWAWMESWVFIGICAAVFIAVWVLDSVGAPVMRRGGRPVEANAPYVILCAVVGALLFAGSLADGGETSWPGLVAGALIGLIGYLALATFVLRAKRRLDAADDPGVVLGLGRDVLTIAVTVLIVYVDVLGYVALAVAIILLLAARRRQEEKYEGLRILR